MEIFDIKNINHLFKNLEEKNSSTFYNIGVGADTFGWRGDPWTFSNENFLQIYPYATCKNFGTLSPIGFPDSLRIILDCFSFEGSPSASLDQNFSLQKTDFIFSTIFSIFRNHCDIEEPAWCFNLEPSEDSLLGFYMPWGFSLLLLDEKRHRGIVMSANPIT